MNLKVITKTKEINEKDFNEDIKYYFCKDIGTVLNTYDAIYIDTINDVIENYTGLKYYEKQTAIEFMKFLINKRIQQSSFPFKYNNDINEINIRYTFNPEYIKTFDSFITHWNNMKQPKDMSNEFKISDIQISNRYFREFYIIENSL